MVEKMTELNKRQLVDRYCRTHNMFLDFNTKWSSDNEVDIYIHTACIGTVDVKSDVHVVNLTGYEVHQDVIEHQYDKYYRDFLKKITQIEGMTWLELQAYIVDCWKDTVETIAGLHYGLKRGA